MFLAGYLCIHTLLLTTFLHIKMQKKYIKNYQKRKSVTRIKTYSRIVRRLLTSMTETESV